MYTGIHIAPSVYICMYIALSVYICIYVKAKRYIEVSYYMLSIATCTGMEWSPFIGSDPKPAEWAPADVIRD